MSVDDAEERIMLGGKVSQKHEIFKTIARMDKDSAFIYLLLKDMDKIKEICVKNPLEAALRIIELDGEVNFMSQCTELTKLSAVLGDTRLKYSQKGLKDELTRKLQESTEP